MKNFLPLFLLIFSLTACAQKRVTLTKGMVIRESVDLAKDTIFLPGGDSLDQPVITIEGENITVDFNGAVLLGSDGKRLPNEFSGLGILVKGRNVTLREAVVRGFKVAVMAAGVDSLRLLDCDFSYNWRPRLFSIREREDFSDWLSFHHNEKDEWLRYGAAIYLKNCRHALVRNVTVTQGMNGLMLVGCNDGLFYNNKIHFNSGVGIGLYRSGRNRVMHNKLDWNVRGYSHGIYQRGQDSAAILVYEQSSENTFAYNSATHSGDGFFLWAGQSTMDTGEGGCNDNLLFANDFSHAPTNGVEVTFSRNKIIMNQLNECTYGIWGGYSFGSLMIGNRVHDCKFGIAIEHGQENVIAGNYFINDTVGIQLWARETQPADWGYAQKRDVSSRDYTIARNAFKDVKNPLKISLTQKVAINDDNQFAGFEKLLVAEKPNRDFYFVKNDVLGAAGWHHAEEYKNMNRILTQLPEFQSSKSEIEPYLAQPMPDLMNAMLPAGHPRGRQYILVDEWGPYDFKYPAAFLRSVEGDQYTFLLMGAPGSNWRASGGEGWASLSQQTGAFPATLIATKMPGAESLTLQFEYVGEAFTDRFGNFHKKGEPHFFNFSRFEKKLDWQVRWHSYDEASDPVRHFEAFIKLKNQSAKASKTVNDLYFAWWGKPAEGIDEEKFATFAETQFEIAPGKYRLRLTSDDGLKFYLDEKLLIDNWDIHEPETNEVEVQLGGKHRFEIEHFEGGGFSTLGFFMEPIF